MPQGFTPLIASIRAFKVGPIQQGCINCVKQLIDAGADVKLPKSTRSRHSFAPCSFNRTWRYCEDLN